MALQRSVATSSLMNAVRKSDDQRLADKEIKVPGKMADVGQRITRAALRNLSNQANVNQQKPGSQKIVNSDKELIKVPNQKVKKAQPQQLTTKEPSQQVQSSRSRVPDSVVEIVPDETSAAEKIEDKCVELQQAVEPVVQPAGPVEEADAMDMSQVSDQGVVIEDDEEEEAFSKQMWKLNVQDIDQDDGNNPQLVSEYINDIYEYMRELEQRLSIKPQCLSHQTEINGRMRGILVDWLVQVHLRFQLLQETLFLTISILDRYLQNENVAKSKLQLVGVTSMWIAAKYEEMYAPEVADFVYITDNTYTTAHIRHMECLILRSLDFELGRPLAIHFLRRNSKAADADAQIHTLAKYLIELTIVDYDMIDIKPSLIAAAALWLALKLVNYQAAWSTTLVYYSRYTEEQVMPVVRKIANLIVHSGNGRLAAIKNKYQSSKLLRISRSSLLDNDLLIDLCDRRLNAAS